MKRSLSLGVIVSLAGWPVTAVAAWSLAGPWATLAVWLAWWPVVIVIALILEGRREHHLERRRPINRSRHPSLRGGVVVRGPWAPRGVTDVKILQGVMPMTGLEEHLKDMPRPPLDDPDGGKRADA